MPWPNSTANIAKSSTGKLKVSAGGNRARAGDSSFAVRRGAGGRFQRGMRRGDGGHSRKFGSDGTILGGLLGTEAARGVLRNDRSGAVSAVLFKVKGAAHGGRKDQ
jgi:hypothetical protein